MKTQILIKRKKITNYSLLLTIFFILICCTKKLEQTTIPRNCLDPKAVFESWHNEAKNKNFEKMFEYEYFDFANVSYCYEKYEHPKLWSKANIKERDSFISLYKSTLKKLLCEREPEKIDSLLRLSDKFQLKVTKYIVNTIDNTADLYIAGDFPGEEIIKLQKVDNIWYLINPFGYHSWMPTKKTLMQKKKQID